MMTELQINIVENDRLQLLCICIAEQQAAGFGTHLDMRQVACPECESPGFNTGWGYWKFTCGSEVLTSE